MNPRVEVSIADHTPMENNTIDAHKNLSNFNQSRPNTTGDIFTMSLIEDKTGQNWSPQDRVKTDQINKH